MKKRKGLIRSLAILLVLILLAYGSSLFFRRAELEMPSFLRTPSAARLLMRMEGFRFSTYENGTMPWSMVAGSADLYENRVARLRAIEIDFSGGGDRSVTLLGDQGTLNTVTGEATITKGARDVRIVTNDGYLMTTSSLVWSSEEQLVRTKDPFTLLGERIYLEGKGLSADTTLQELMVMSNVKAVLQE